MNTLTPNIVIFFSIFYIFFPKNVLSVFNLFIIKLKDPQGAYMLEIIDHPYFLQINGNSYEPITIIPKVGVIWHENRRHDIHERKNIHYFDYIFANNDEGRGWTVRFPKIYDKDGKRLHLNREKLAQLLDTMRVSYFRSYEHLSLSSNELPFLLDLIDYEKLPLDFSITLGLYSE